MLLIWDVGLSRAAALALAVPAPGCAWSLRLLPVYTTGGPPLAYSLALF